MKTDSLVSEIVSKINNEMSDIENVEAVLSYSGSCIRAPIKKIYLSFMTGENNVSHYNDETEKCCRLNKISISMNCYSPANLAAQEVIAKAEEVLSRLCDAFGGEMTGYKLEKARLDDDSKAVKIPCTLFFRYESCPAYDIENSVLVPFADFMCKAHVKDESLHLSEKEKDFVSRPIVTGRYTGTGEEDHKVILGFRPKLLIIYELGSQLFAYDPVNAQVHYRFAVCGSGGNMRGVTLTKDGFKISKSISVKVNGSVCELNDVLLTYAYIAVR